MESPLKGNFRVSQEFGNDFKINGKWVYRSLGYDGHMGVDFAGTVPGTKLPVFFPIDGYVYRKTDSGLSGYGKHVILHFRWNGQKYRFTFGHLDSFGDFKQGDEIKAGTFMGNMGTTGLSTGVHLHWDCMVLTDNNTPVYATNGYKGFVDFLGLIRGNCTEDMVKNALLSFLGDKKETYIEKVNNWLIENNIVQVGDFSEDMVRGIIANYRITKKIHENRKLTPFPEL